VKLSLIGTTTLVLLAAACSSSDDATPPAIDAGVEAGRAPVGPDQDAGAPDVARAPVEAAARLEVACSNDPCYVAVSGNGGEHFCGLLKDGTVRCWGRDSRVRAEDGGVTAGDGALGRGHAVSIVEGATPAPVAALAGVKQIAVGRNLGTCALTNEGAVYCWGRNEFGQLGRPSSEALPVATRIEGLPPASAIALGASTGCAIAADGGALWCWGAQASRIGAAAIPGDGDTFPPQVMPGFKAPVRELAVGSAPQVPTEPNQDTIVALQEGGVLVSLGELPAGESSATTPVSSAPTEVHGVVRIGAFGYLDKTGILSRWVPSLRALYVSTPAAVVDVLITASTDFSGVRPTPYVEQAGVLLASGRLYRWGRNNSGALGYALDTVDIAEEPLDMTHVAGGRVVSFAMTSASTCVSIDDGAVKCWGANQRGELGRGAVDGSQHPEAEKIR
jgi:hypothetical protein